MKRKNEHLKRLLAGLMASAVCAVSVPMHSASAGTADSVKEDVPIVSVGNYCDVFVDKLPDKLIYEIGESLDLTGGLGTVRGCYDGVYTSVKSKPLSSEYFMIDDTRFNNQVPGTYTIYVLDAHMLTRTSFDVVVAEKDAVLTATVPAVTTMPTTCLTTTVTPMETKPGETTAVDDVYFYKLSIEQHPAKLVYEIGEELDLSDCRVEIYGYNSSGDYVTHTDLPLTSDLLEVDTSAFNNQVPGTYAIRIYAAGTAYFTNLITAVIGNGVTITTGTTATAMTTAPTDVSAHCDVCGAEIADGEGYSTPLGLYICQDCKDAGAGGTTPPISTTVTTTTVPLITTVSDVSCCDICGAEIADGEGYSTPLGLYICQDCKDAGAGGTTAPISTTVTTQDTNNGASSYCSISILNLPYKMVYQLGEPLDLTGCTASACGYEEEYSIYWDTPEESVLGSINFTVDASEFNSQVPGTYTIYVHPTGHAEFDTFTVTVMADAGTTIPETITTTTTTTATTFDEFCDIFMRQLPDKMIYLVGEELDLTGATAEACGRTAEGEDWDTFERSLDWFQVDTSEFNNQIPGEYTIYVRMNNYEEYAYAAFTITVKDSANIPVGDVNWDEDVDLDDALMVLNTYAKFAANADTSNLSEIYLKAADVDQNGAIELKDAGVILKHYAELAAGLVS